MSAKPSPVLRTLLATLDFYIWLVWKTWTVNRASVRIPLFGPHGLSQQLGTAEYSNGRFFRRKLQHWLRQVKVVWPDCPAAISNDGQVLVVRSSNTSPAIQTANKYEVGVSPPCAKGCPPYPSFSRTTNYTIQDGDFSGRITHWAERMLRGYKTWSGQSSSRQVKTSLRGPHPALRGPCEPDQPG